MLFNKLQTNYQLKPLGETVADPQGSKSSGPSIQHGGEPSAHLDDDDDLYYDEEDEEEEVVEYK